MLAESRRTVIHNMDDSAFGSFPLISITVRRQHANESIRAGRLMLIDLPVSHDASFLGALSLIESLAADAKSDLTPSPPGSEAPSIVKIIHVRFL